jgi:CheY-like chemotaxis protein
MPKRPLVIIVDDSEDDVLLVRRSVAKAGLRVELVSFFSCKFARAALDQVRKGDGKPPRLLILDVKLPGESGFELLEWIRSTAELRDLPVVIASASIAPVDLQQASELGACGYVEKSADSSALLEAIRHCLEGPAPTGLLKAKWNVLCSVSAPRAAG